MIQKFGQYILLQKVGSGGMAELFKAKKVGIEGFERVLAIKRILPHLSADEEFIGMFIEEAKLVARLNHKNITQVYDFGKIESNYFLAMEYIRGKDLRSILKRCREKEIRFPVALAIFIAREIAAGLHYAHTLKDNAGKSLNIIHRDVSPQNILISYDGDVKIVDFGIAKAGGHSRTSTGVLKGKLSYMSPEQAWGKPVDHRSDIFSLGIVLYEMVTGERLFKGDSEINTLEKVRAAEIEPLPSKLNLDLSPGLEEKMLRALARELPDRYQTSADLASDMGGALYEVLATDPSAFLKQFMHNLFRAEIDGESRAELEENTVQVSMEEKTVTGESTISEARAKKKSFSPVAAIIAASVVLVVVAVFWIAGAKKTDTKPEAPAPSPVSQQKEEVTRKVEIPVKPSPHAGETAPKAAIPNSGKDKETPREEGKGSLAVNAVPWANVILNGKPYGSTPKMIEGLKAGKVRLRLENPNFPAWETTVNIARGQAANVSHKFKGPGRLVVNATPWGNVYVDGELKGQTPLTIERISSGRHALKIGREGFSDVEKNVDIGDGETEKISVNLRKIE